MLKTLLRLSPLALALTASAQHAPIYIGLPGTLYGSDVAVQDGDIVVSAIEGGTAFTWRASTGTVTAIGNVDASGIVRLSDDGTQIVATVPGIDGIWRAARQTGGISWSQFPDQGFSQDLVASHGRAISGNGLVYAGKFKLGGGPDWHACSWTVANGLVDLGGFFGDPNSQITAASFDGSVLVGGKFVANLSGVEQGARWVNGVYTGMVHVASPSYRLGLARAVNGPGTIIVGDNRTVTAVSPAKAWRWDSVGNVTTILNNAPNVPSNISPETRGLTDDGSLIIGFSGGTQANPNPHGPAAVVWVYNSPDYLGSWLSSQGLTGVFPAFAHAITPEGAAILVSDGNGFGAFAFGVVVFPDKLPVGEAFCSGDGSATACPCTNPGAAGHGCANSLIAAGALLRATGFARVSDDSVTLRGSDMPNGACLYFQGTTQVNGGNGSTFGDGLRCVAGTLRRFKVKTNVNNASSYPGAGDNPISVAGEILAGGTRMYQGWYRNANPTFCTSEAFNLTNGLEIVWTP